MLDYDICKNWRFDEIVQTYTQRDTMLYALGLGYGSDPMNREELRFVHETHLLTVPTMLTAMGSPGLWWNDPRTRADPVKLVHGEQDLRIFRTVPSSGTLVVRNRVHSLTDKGAGKGAVAVTLRELVLRETNETLAQGRNVAFLRGDGGFSGNDGQSDPAPEPLPAAPARTADLEVAYTSSPRAALIYRLSGDYNPLHADPEFSARAGFERPILHGLCTPTVWRPAQSSRRCSPTTQPGCAASPPVSLRRSGRARRCATSCGAREPPCCTCVPWWTSAAPSF